MVNTVYQRFPRPRTRRFRGFGGGGEAPLNPADWPDLKLWLRADAAVDRSADPVDGGFTVVNNDAGQSAEGFVTSPDLNRRQWAHSAAPPATTAKVTGIGSKAVILEFQLILTASRGGMRRLLSIGDGTAAQGLAVTTAWDGTNNRIALRVRGASSAQVADFGGSLVVPPNTLAHLVVFWNGSGDSSPTVCGGSVNGGTIVAGSFAATPGAVTPAATPRVIDRWSTAPATFRSARVWLLDDIPADMQAVVEEMAASPNGLPPLLEAA